MTPELKLHVDRRGRVFVENATAEIMEALRALGWTGHLSPKIDVNVNSSDATHTEGGDRR